MIPIAIVLWTVAGSGGTKAAFFSTYCGCDHRLGLLAAISGGYSIFQVSQPDIS